MRLFAILTLALSLLAQSPAITETQWRLKKIGTDAVVPGKGQKKPYLKLESKGKVIGFSGCNRLMGDYKLKGADLSFGPTVGTKVACAQGMDTEKLFVQALPKVKTYKITGQALDLLDSAGKVLAQFEAVTDKAK